MAKTTPKATRRPPKERAATSLMFALPHLQDARNAFVTVTTYEESSICTSLDEILIRVGRALKVLEHEATNG